MGALCMVIGESGSGKSSSLRNFAQGECGIFNVAGKPLPFRNRLASIDHPSYEDIEKVMAANKSRAYVIDDSTYLMQFEMFDHIKENGYQKFSAMAQNFERLLRRCAATDANTVVYFLHHPQFGDDGKAKPQTVGKMLDNQLNVEGLFPIVLECTVRDGEHVFVTNGHGIAKSPMGMFPETVPNDLKAVDAAIREYWGMEPLTSGGKAKGKAGAA